MRIRSGSLKSGPQRNKQDKAGAQDCAIDDSDVIMLDDGDADTTNAEGDSHGDDDCCASEEATRGRSKHGKSLMGHTKQDQAIKLLSREQQLTRLSLLAERMCLQPPAGLGLHGPITADRLLAHAYQAGLSVGSDGRQVHYLRHGDGKWVRTLPLFIKALWQLPPSAWQGLQVADTPMRAAAKDAVAAIKLQSHSRSRRKRKAPEALQGAHDHQMEAIKRTSADGPARQHSSSIHAHQSSSNTESDGRDGKQQTHSAGAGHNSAAETDIVDSGHAEGMGCDCVLVGSLDAGTHEEMDIGQAPETTACTQVDLGMHTAGGAALGTQYITADVGEEEGEEARIIKEAQAAVELLDSMSQRLRHTSNSSHEALTQLKALRSTLNKRLQARASLSDDPEALAQVQPIVDSCLAGISGELRHRTALIELLHNLQDHDALEQQRQQLQEEKAALDQRQQQLLTVRPEHTVHPEQGKHQQQQEQGPAAEHQRQQGGQGWDAAGEMDRKNEELQWQELPGGDQVQRAGKEEALAHLEEDRNALSMLRQQLEEKQAQICRQQHELEQQQAAASAVTESLVKAQELWQGAERQQLLQEHEQLQQEHAELQQQHDQLHQQHANLQQQHKQLQQQHGEVQRQQQGELQCRCEQLQQELETAEQELSVLRAGNQADA